MGKSKLALDFTDKVVLVTGAASGIGAATAEMFARLGASLALVDQNEHGLKKTMRKCCRVGGFESYGASANLTNPPDIECLSQKVIDRYGRCDVLINGAGFMPMNSLEDTELECLQLVFDSNVRSMFYLTQLMLPHLLESKGNVVNISSVCGLRAFPNLIAYNMSKAAVDQFTRSLALEVGPQGVRVNAVNPGVIRTNLQLTGGMDQKSYDEFIKRSKKTHALGRVGKPKEVASCICFLASHLASFVTGVTLSVDGGKQLMCPR